jgi:protein gp37
MHPRWIRSLRDQCAIAGVPFLFKHWGEYAEDRQHGMATGMDGEIRAHRFHDGVLVERVGKKAAGRLLDGVQHDGYPKPIQ